MKNYFCSLSVLLLALSVLFQAKAYAFLLPSSKSWIDPSNFSILATSGFSYDGIVTFPDCSGSYVKFKATPSSAFGLVLTNGHCLYIPPKPGEIISDERNTAYYKAWILNRDGSALTLERTRRIVYATMTDTDIALLELRKTYAEIEAETGVKPLLISDLAPLPKTAIDIPSGFWKHTYSCEIEAIVPILKEGGYQWVNSLRYSSSGCEVVNGSSGSPILSSVSGEVIGINNTLNENGQSCTMENPCEVDIAGNISIIKGRGYGQQTYKLSTCVDAKGTFDLATPGCLLPQ